MPKKKKGGKSDAAKEEEVKPPPPVIKGAMIRIKFRLIHWDFMIFSMLFREDAYIFTLKRIIKEKHGRVSNLKLCFHSFTEPNEVVDEMLTLKECGLHGFPVGGALTPEEREMEDKAIPTIELYYDYTAADSADPVLLYFR